MNYFKMSQDEIISIFNKASSKISVRKLAEELNLAYSKIYRILNKETDKVAFEDIQKMVAWLEGQGVPEKLKSKYDIEITQGENLSGVEMYGLLIWIDPCKNNTKKIANEMIEHLSKREVK